MSTPHCLVCGKNSHKPLYEDTLLQCRSCGFIFANMALGEETLKQVYSTYFQTSEIFDYFGTKPSRQLNFRKRLRRIAGLIGSDSMTNILEIGAAYGFFGEVVQEELPAASYVGIDVAKEPVCHAVNELGLNVIAGDYLQQKWDAPFSDIFMWDVIEHLARPQDFIAKAYRDLTPGGRVIIGTPDIDTPLPKLRGRHWRNIHPPTHLQYFSARTLSQLMKNHGFTVQAVLHPAVWRSARLIYHFVVLKRFDNALTQLLFKCIPPELTIPLNTLDNMVIIARKP